MLVGIVVTTAIRPATCSCGGGTGSRSWNRRLRSSGVHALRRRFERTAVGLPEALV